MRSPPRVLKNPFLSKVNAAMRNQRMPIPPRFSYKVRPSDTATGARHVSVWFRTAGCSHDRRGECTMCNYGYSTPTTAEEMIESVRQALASVDLDAKTTLYVSPSGSMFDEAEVPRVAREAIFQLVRETACRVYNCETRLEHLLPDRVERFAQILDNKRRAIETGLETATPWAAAYCLNKRVPRHRFASTMELLARHQIFSSSNVLVGMPFLSPRELIEEAVATSRWALARGSRTCVVFPTHVKRGTLVGWLWQHGLYQPPPIWSLVEVFVRLGPEVAEQMRVSWWYKRRTDPTIRAASESCPACYPTVVKHLDAYRATLDYENIDRLAALECQCKEAWRASLDEAPAAPIRARIMEAYEAIGRGILGDDWWDEHGPAVAQRVATDVPEVPIFAPEAGGDLAVPVHAREDGGA